MLRKLRLRTKILGAFAVVISVIGLQSFMTNSSVETSRESTHSVDLANDILIDLLETEATLLDIQRHYRGFMLTGSDVFFDDYTATKALYNTEISDLIATTTDPESLAQWNEANRLADAWIDDALEAGIELRRGVENGVSTAEQVDEFVSAGVDTEGFQAAMTAFEVGEQIQLDRLAELQASAEEASDTLVVTIWTLMGAAIAAAVALGMVLTRAISGPAKSMLEAAREIAETDLVQLEATLTAVRNGDLTVTYATSATEVKVKNEDEIGQLGTVFNDMIGRLRTTGAAVGDMVQGLRELVTQANEVTGRVHEGSQTLAQASGDAARAAGEVAGSISSVAEGTGAQARASEDVSDAVNTIVSEVDTTTTSVTAVSDAADEATNRALAGRAQIDEAISSMQGITASIGRASSTVTELGNASDKVVEIVELIRSIAGQTNLLALNAAIEAARAGEAGRGFAVVATEVKALAEESAVSTEQIAAIVDEMRATVSETVAAIESGREQADAGAGVVSSAGSAFEAISDSVNQISARLGEVVAATGRIGQASKTINAASTSLVSVAEANSAASEEVAAASEESAATAEEIGATAEDLSASATQLTATMGRFRLN
jgi:methyl-accepting chemotaxis protein